MLQNLYYPKAYAIGSIVIWIDEDVRVLDGLDTSAAVDDTIVILPAMAGG